MGVDHPASPSFSLALDSVSHLETSWESLTSESIEDTEKRDMRWWYKSLKEKPSIGRLPVVDDLSYNQELKVNKARDTLQKLMMLTSTTTSNPCRHECFHIRFLSSCSITLLLLLVVVVSRTNAFATHYNVCVNKTRFEEVRRNGLGPACIGVTLQATKHRQTSDNDTELSLGFGSSCFESNSCTLSFIAYKDDRTSETSKFAFYAESFKNDTVAIVPVVDLYITQEPIDNFEVHPLDYTYGTVMAKNLGGGRTPLGVYNLHTGVAVLVSSNKSDSEDRKSVV